MNSLVHSAASGSIPVADLSALSAKLEAAEGGPELEAAICVALQYGGPNSEGATNVRTDDAWEGDLLFEQGSDECCNPIPALTTSLDAALALADRVLPGWLLSLDQNHDGRWMAAVAKYWNRERLESLEYAYAPAPALALCIAILKAHASRAVEGE